MALFAEQERIFWDTGDTGFLLESLEVQDKVLFNRGDPDGALSRFREMEQVHCERGDLDGVTRLRELQVSIGKGKSGSDEAA